MSSGLIEEMIPIVGMMIPITAIVLGIGAGIVKSVLASQERRLEMRLRTQQAQDDDVLRQVQALRAEVASLRDTSTQFDLSLDQTVQSLERRVDQMEVKTPSPPYIAPPAPEEQSLRVGLRK